MPFAPTDIAGLQAWYKADALVLNDADPVGSWADSSGNARTLTEATNKPVYKTNIVNSKPIVRFNGSNAKLIHQAGAAFLTGTTATLAVVSIARAANAGKRHMAIRNSANANDYDSVTEWITYCSSGTTLGIFRNNAQKTNQTISTASTLVDLYWLDGTNANQRHNGAAAGTPSGASTGTLSVDNLTVGTGWNVGAAANFAQVDIAEICLYDSSLSSTNRTDLENYLLTKYGLPATLSGTGAISGAGSVTASGTRSAIAAASVSGLGSIAATGGRSTFATSAVTGVGSVAAAGTRSTFATGSIAGSGSVSATGIRVRLGSASIAGSGSVAATGTRSAVVTGAIAGAGSITVAGVRTTAGAASIGGSGSVAASGVRSAVGAGSIAGGGAVAANAVRTAYGQSEIQGTGGVNALGGVTHYGAASITGTSSILGAGVRNTYGSASIAGVGTLATDATVIPQFNLRYGTSPVVGLYLGENPVMTR